MTRSTTSLAAVYLSITFLLTSFPVIHSRTTPSPSQQQLVYLLHNIFKGESGTVNAAKNVSDNFTLPVGATVSPLMNLLLLGVKNLQNSLSEQNSTTGPTHSNGTMQPKGDIMSALRQNTLVNELISIVYQQILTAQKDAVQHNITIGQDLSSMLGLIKPLEVIQKLVTSHPARSVVPNRPAGKANDACYRDFMDTLDSVAANIL